MATKKKMLQAAAGNAGGGVLNVEDVFSTYLYEGNGSTQTITNGIDLDGEGGIVWIKDRGTASFSDNSISHDGAGFHQTHQTYAYGASSQYITSFNSNGFNIGTSRSESSHNYASWTFRKAPKFFTCVQYTGTGGATTVAHNLGTTVGSLIIKRTDTAQNWYVYHRGVNFGATQYPLLVLNTTAAASANKELINSTEPTDAVFSVASDLNTSGGTYVAYLFAHNDGDGDFGPDGDADIIKCGSYTGTGVEGDNTISLGFEPQWVLIKRSDAVSGGWLLFDTMRGLTSGNPADDKYLWANKSDAEGTTTAISPESTGFTLESSGGDLNASGGTYIYIAIRRGTKVPESGTEVFAPDFNYNTNTNYQAYLGAPADMWLGKNPSSFWPIVTRLTGGNYLRTNENSAETSSTQVVWDNMLGYNESSGTPDTSRINYVWKRAPNFFDVVAYTGDGTAGRTVSHNLGVVPEMMWVKRRSGDRTWFVYSTSLGNAYSLNLDNGIVRTTGHWNSTNPTEDVFTLSDSSVVNGNGDTYIAYLFATLDGVSKVGSYTGNGSSKTIDCSFTSGARFVLIKRFDIDNTDPDGDWYVWDTERGIVTGNDPHLSLNTTAAEVTTDDSIDPDSSGFIVNQVAATNINVSSASYIFYAVA